MRLSSHIKKLTQQRKKNSAKCVLFNFFKGDVERVRKKQEIRKCPLWLVKIKNRGHKISSVNTADYKKYTSVLYYSWNREMKTERSDRGDISMESENVWDGKGRVAVGVEMGWNFEEEERQANQELQEGLLRALPLGFLSSLFPLKPELSMLQPRLPTSSSRGWTICRRRRLGRRLESRAESLPGQQQWCTKGWEPAKCQDQHPALSHRTVFFRWGSICVENSQEVNFKRKVMRTYVRAQAEELNITVLAYILQHLFFILITINSTFRFASCAGNTTNTSSV